MSGSNPGSARLGVLALGDSITNGGGELQWGVALQSWALWTARGLGLPYSPYAVDGAQIVHVREFQIPAHARLAADPEARYHLGCLYVGTNDVRSPAWEPASFAEGMDAALGWLAARCERTLVATIRRDLGRPRVPLQRVESANAIIEGAAARFGSLVLDLREFGARNLVMADHVHPTAFGQIAIAERALALLERDGMSVRIRPSQLIVHSSTSWERLRSDWTYAYRRAKVAVAALRMMRGPG
jgi:hypothetical protein